MHAGVVVLLFVMLHVFGLGAIALVGMCIVALLLAYEHSIVGPSDISRMNAAFFTLNGIISVVFFLSMATDVLVRRR
jgi:4-hydroxybenzoate polyprenyltransferase